MNTHFENVMGQLAKLAKSPIHRPEKTITVDIEDGDDSPEAIHSRIMGKSQKKVKVRNELHFEYQKLKLSIRPDNPRYIIKTVKHRDTKLY